MKFITAASITLILAIIALPDILQAQTIQNVPVDTSEVGKFECMIAVNPLDSLNLVSAHIRSQSSDGKSTILLFSQNGGNSWSPSDLSMNPSDGGDPWVAYGPNGMAYFTVLGDGGIEIWRSSDGGKTWPDTSSMMNDGKTASDEPVLAVDNNSASPLRGSVYVAAVDQTGGLFPSGIMVQSSDADLTMRSAITHATQQQIVQIPHMTIGPSGKIYLTYLAVTDLNTLSGGLYINSSKDGGNSWSADHLIRTAQYVDSTNGFPKQGYPLASRIGPTPRIAIDTSNGPRRGWLYVCYALPTRSQFPHALNVFLQHSSDDGNTWSDPIQVNNDFSDTLNDHLTPSMVIAPDGTIGVVFYDRRDDVNNLLATIYLATSTDGGSTFTNIPITSTTTNPLLGYQSSSISIADYIGLTATRSNFFPIWTDGRKNNGVLDIYSAIVPTTAASIVTVAPNVEHNIQIYPNPLTQSTTISFTPETSGYAEVAIVNPLGVEVARLFSGELEAGEHSFEWGNTSGLPDGVYQCIIRMNGRAETIPIVLLR